MVEKYLISQNPLPVLNFCELQYSKCLLFPFNFQKDLVNSHSLIEKEPIFKLWILHKPLFFGYLIEKNL